MTQIRVRIEEHYEVQEIPSDKDYVWVPAHALIECDYGQVMDVDIHHTTCPGCSRDHTAVVQEVAGRHLRDDVRHPWYREYQQWIKFKKSHPGYDEKWAEITALE